MRKPVHASITESPISLSLVEDLALPSDGAVVTFVGVVRDETEGRAVDLLEYESYQELAERQLDEMGQEALDRWGLGAVVLIHRVGKLNVGEASVLVAVSAPHRQEAFEACHGLIDALKEKVAVWKKELFADGGERWVEHA